MEKKQWFEKENFWLEYGPIMFDPQRWAEAAKVAEEICRLANLKAGDSLLDACCGPGRVSLEFALLGLDVTGVDITQPFLDAAKESAEDEGVNLNLINCDMRTFTSAQKFDAAVNLYTSFGYCDTVEEDFAILQRMYEALKPGGTFVLESLGREIAVRDFTEGEWFERAGKTVLTEFTAVNDWQGLRSHWILIDNKTGERIDHTFVQRLYSAVDIKKMLLDCGFKTVNICGDFDLSPYDHKARTMVLVAKK